MEFVQNASSILGLILTTTTILGLIVKPIRAWVIRIVKQTVTPEEPNPKPATQAVEIVHCHAPEREELLAQFKGFRDEFAQVKESIACLMDATRDGLRNDILELCDKCLTRGYITSIEKMDLMDMYKSYHDRLNGDSYCTDRYNAALELEER